MTQVKHSAKMVAGIIINGVEDMKAREVFNLNQITPDALVAEITRSYKRISHVINGLGPAELKGHIMFVNVALDNASTYGAEYSPYINHSLDGVNASLRLGMNEAPVITGDYPKAFHMPTGFVLHSWKRKPAVDETAAAETEGKEDKQAMIQSVIQAGRAELLNSMEPIEAYAVMVQEIAAAQTAIAQEEPQSKEEVPMKTEPIVTVQPAAVPQEATMTMTQVQELLAKQEEQTLARIALMLEAQKAPVAEVKVDLVKTEVVTAAPVQATTKAERSARKLQGLQAARQITSDSVRVAGSTTASGLRLATDLLAAAIITVGHGAATGIEKGTGWVATKIEVKAGTEKEVILDSATPRLI